MRRSSGNGSCSPGTRRLSAQHLTDPTPSPSPPPRDSTNRYELDSRGPVISSRLKLLSFSPPLAFSLDSCPISPLNLTESPLDAIPSDHRLPLLLAQSWLDRVRPHPTPSHTGHSSGIKTSAIDFPGIRSMAPGYQRDEGGETSK